METYGINLTPHFERYQNQDTETADLMQLTWNFGNLLKGQGYTVCYMHGPVAMYEGITLVAGKLEFLTDNHLHEFVQNNNENKEQIYFLYQKSKKAIRYAILTKETVSKNRDDNKRIKKEKVKIN